jgi:hypothetical protein
MEDVLDDVPVDVFSELNSSLIDTGGTILVALTRERDEREVLAAIAVYPSDTVWQYAAIQTLVADHYSLVA